MELHQQVSKSQTEPIEIDEAESPDTDANTNAMAEASKLNGIVVLIQNVLVLKKVTSIIIIVETRHKTLSV
jgi:hypothetical protein